MLGANDLVFSEHGEIGPLDIQMEKKDDLFESESGLTVTTALTALHENAQEAFDHFFATVSRKSRGRITVRTASDIAARLAEALYSKVAAQLDPIHIGEVYRSMAIAREYGTRLMAKSQNFDSEALDELITAYPSHGFVIDKEEAAEKFRNVRECTLDESVLVEELGDIARVPSNRPMVRYISDDIMKGAEDATTTSVKGETILESPGIPRTAAQATGDTATNGQAAVIPA